MGSVNSVLLSGTVVDGRGASAKTSSSSGAFQSALDEASAPKNDTKKIADAAHGFEALMIGQILKASHGSGSDGWLGAGDDDESSSTAIQMAEEYLGQAISQGGGLGIAKMVVKNLSKAPATPPNSGLTPDHQTLTRKGLSPQAASPETR